MRRLDIVAESHRSTTDAVGTWLLSITAFFARLAGETSLHRTLAIFKADLWSRHASVSEYKG